MRTSSKWWTELTTVSLITAVPAVPNAVTLCVLFQDAGTTFALISDCRAGRFWQTTYDRTRDDYQWPEGAFHFKKLQTYTYPECSWVHRLHWCSLFLRCIQEEDAGDCWDHSSSSALLWRYASFSNLWLIPQPTNAFKQHAGQLWTSWKPQYSVTC